MSPAPARQRLCFQTKPTRTHAARPRQCRVLRVSRSPAGFSCPDFSCELALASSSTHPALPPVAKPSRNLAPSTAARSAPAIPPRAKSLPWRDGCRGSRSSPAPLLRAILDFYCHFFSPSSFSFFFFFLSTWHASISTPLTRSGFQPGEHRNGLIISDEESVCSITQRRVIIYL